MIAPPNLPGRRTRCALLLGAVSGLWACGGGEAPTGPSRIKLADVESAQLSERVMATDGKTVFEHDFSTGVEGWHRVTDPVEPLAVEEDLLQVTVGEDGTSFARLAGTRGARCISPP